MPNTCVIPNCLSSETSKCIFKVPSDLTCRQNWIDSILTAYPTLHNLPEVFSICEDHFERNDIISIKSIEDTNGKFIFENLTSKKLKNEAVPDFSSAHEKVPKRNDSVLYNVADNNHYENQLNSKVSNGEEYKTTKDNTYELLSNTDHNYIIEESMQSNDETINCDQNNRGTIIDLTKEDDNKVQQTPSILFQKIFQEETKVILPDSSWGIYRFSTKPREVIFAQAEKITLSSKLIKQVSISEELQLKLIFYDKHIPVVNRAIIKSVKDIENLIKAIHNITLCQGGPTLDSFPDINPLCSIRDTVAHKWRHKKCPIIYCESVCHFCASSYKTLQRHMDRKKNRITRSDLRRIVKKEIALINSKKRMRIQKFKRYQMKKKLTREAIANLRQEIQQNEQTTFKNTCTRELSSNIKDDSIEEEFNDNTEPNFSSSEKLSEQMNSVLHENENELKSERIDTKRFKTFKDSTYQLSSNVNNNIVEDLINSNVETDKSDQSNMGNSNEIMSMSPPPIPNTAGIIDLTKEENETAMAVINVEVDQKLRREIFQKLLQSDVKINLPNSSWKIYRFLAEPRDVIFAQDECNNELFKQIIIGENLRYQIVLYGQNFCDSEIFTLNNIKDIESLIRIVDRYHLCPGGPTLDIYPNINPHFAIRDIIANRWRNNKCPMKISIDKDVCLSCKSLFKTLREYVESIKKLKAERNFIYSRAKEVPLLNQPKSVKTYKFEWGELKGKFAQKVITNLKNKVHQIEPPKKKIRYWRTRLSETELSEDEWDVASKRDISFKRTKTNFEQINLHLYDDEKNNRIYEIDLNNMDRENCEAMVDYTYELLIVTDNNIVQNTIQSNDGIKNCAQSKSSEILPVSHSSTPITTGIIDLTKDDETVMDFDYSDFRKESLNAIFQEIFLGKVKCKLPDSSWGIYRIFTPSQRVMFAQAKKIKLNTKFIKQFILDANLDYEIFYYGKNLPTFEHYSSEYTFLVSIRQIEYLIEDIHQNTLCKGGRTLDRYIDITPKFAIKDLMAHKWRHKKCRIESYDEICQHCKTLSSTLRLHERRIQMKEIENAITHTKKTKTPLMNKKNYVKIQAIKRCHLNGKLTREVIEDLYERTQKIEQAAAKDSPIEEAVQDSQVLLQRPRLEENAVPTLFGDAALTLPSHCPIIDINSNENDPKANSILNVKYEVPNDIHQIQTEIHNQAEQISNDNENNSNIKLKTEDLISTEYYNYIDNEVIHFNVDDDDDNNDLQMIRKDNEHQTQVIDMATIHMEHNYTDKCYLDSELIYLNPPSIATKIAKTTLPKSWNVKEKFIKDTTHLVLMFTIDRKINGIETPMVQRCVMINTQSANIRYFIHGVEIKNINNELLPSTLRNLTILPEVLVKFQRTRICQGFGDVDSHFISDVDAYRDALNDWRHKQCTLLSDNKTCEYCRKFRKLLVQRQTRARIRLVNGVKLTRIHNTYNEIDQQKLKAMRKKLNIERRKKNRALLQVKKLHKNLRETQDKITNIEGKSFEEKFHELGIDEAQILTLNEIIAAAKGSPQGRRYSQDWITFCNSVNFKSPEAYEFLRSSNIIPLPCVKTIRKYSKESTVS